MKRNSMNGMQSEVHGAMTEFLKTIPELRRNGRARRKIVSLSRGLARQAAKRAALQVASAWARAH